MRALVVLALLAAIAAPANAWWCTGHMTIAQIAKSVMDQNTISTVESIVQTLSQEGPFPQSPDFMQVACWADDLKSSGLYPMAGWHFINQPYDPSNFPIAQSPIQKINVETVITDLDKAVKKNKHNTQGWIIGFSIANLIHFYGDIHQPLHVTELFSSTYPTGDEGGNAEQVTINGVQTRLHFIWDSICWEYNQELTRPLNDTARSTVTTLATRLMSQYTFSDSQMKEFNSTVMAQEGFQDAISTAYPGTSNGMTISQDYINKCIPVAEARVALAGYRLGNQLQYLLSSFGHDAHLFARKTLDHIVEGRRDVMTASARFTHARKAAKKTAKRA